MLLRQGLPRAPAAAAQCRMHHAPSRPAHQARACSSSLTLSFCRGVLSAPAVTVAEYAMLDRIACFFQNPQRVRVLAALIRGNGSLPCMRTCSWFVVAYAAAYPARTTYLTRCDSGPRLGWGGGARKHEWRLLHAGDAYNALGRVHVRKRLDAHRRRHSARVNVAAPDGGVVRTTVAQIHFVALMMANGVLRQVAAQCDAVEAHNALQTTSRATARAVAGPGFKRRAYVPCTQQTAISVHCDSQVFIASSTAPIVTTVCHGSACARPSDGARRGPGDRHHDAVPRTPA
jgi:hypothetical protein